MSCYNTIPRNLRLRLQESLIDAIFNIHNFLCVNKNMYLCIIIIKNNNYMKKVFIKFKECFCDFIGGMLEDEYIDMCMKQEYLNKVNKK